MFWEIELKKGKQSPKIIPYSEPQKKLAVVGIYRAKQEQLEIINKAEISKIVQYSQLTFIRAHTFLEAEPSPRTQFLSGHSHVIFAGSTFSGNTYRHLSPSWRSAWSKQPRRFTLLKRNRNSVTLLLDGIFFLILQRWLKCLKLFQVYAQ